MILKFCSHSTMDGTLKYQFLTSDGYCIEACVVFFWEKPAPINVCISSQVGCECSCSFCVTGHKRFVRNLSAEEILTQLKLITDDNAEILKSNFEITYMGTGEPLQNWTNVFESAKIFSDRYTQLYRINISSIFPRIDLPLEDIYTIKTPVHFQFSLHFVTDELRRKYFRRDLPSIASVLTRLNQLHKTLDYPYCINYILFETINDQLQDAKELVEMVKSIPAYLKISKYCPIAESELKVSTNYEEFTSVLVASGVRWKTFESKGVDIHAACGHLLTDIQF